MSLSLPNDFLTSVLLAYLLSLPFAGLCVWLLRGRWQRASTLRRALGAGLVFGGWNAVAFVSWAFFLGVPAMRSHQAYARQPSEARQTLKALYAMQREVLMETDRYQAAFEKVGFEPPPGAPYTIHLGDRVAGAKDSGVRCRVTGAWPDGAPIERTEARDDAFVATAVLPRENETFCWSLASFDRQSPEGFTIAAGQPFDEEPLRAP